MATIENLNISITSMKHEEAFALVKQLRESRRTPKNIKFVVKRETTTKPRVAKATKPKDLATLLSPEQRAALKKLLMEELGNA